MAFNHEVVGSTPTGRTMDQKYCTKCNCLKDKTEFNKNKVKCDGLQTYCRSCTGVEFKQYYKENAPHQKELVTKNKKKYINKAKDYLVSYLKEHPCIDCGESDPVVLEFDHVTGTKENSICRMTFIGCSLAKIQKEIEKCVVRCANCHRRKTAKQLGYYKIK